MPRKSDAGPIPGAGPPPGEKDANGGVSIDENVLPKSIVTRLAKGVLPQNTNIQKDAVLALTKGATVFINYLCNAANENAVKSNKKTIMPKDVLEAISQLELDEFGSRLQAELAKFEEITSEKRAASKKAAKDKEVAKGGADGSPGKTSPAHGSANGDEEGADEEEADTPPPAKKRKANGKAAPVNGNKSKKVMPGVKPDVDDVDDEDDLGDDKEDYQEDEEEEEEIYDEEEETQDAVEDNVVEDLDEAVRGEDEALDNGYDSD